MKKNQLLNRPPRRSELFHKENSVSPIIGTILLVALVMISVTIASMILVGMAGNVGSRPAFTSVDIGLDGDNIFVKHKNGEALEAGQLKIYCDGVDRTGRFSGAENKLSSGSIVRWENCALIVNSVTVFKKDGNTEWFIDSKYIGKGFVNNYPVKDLIENADNYCLFDKDELRKKCEREKRVRTDASWTYTWDNSYGLRWLKSYAGDRYNNDYFYFPKGFMIKYSDEYYVMYTPHTGGFYSQRTEPIWKGENVPTGFVKINTGYSYLKSYAIPSIANKGQVYFDGMNIYVLIADSATLFPTNTALGAESNGWICCGSA